MAVLVVYSKYNTDETRINPRYLYDTKFRYNAGWEIAGGVKSNCSAAEAQQYKGGEGNKTHKCILVYNQDNTPRHTLHEPGLYTSIP